MYIQLLQSVDKSLPLGLLACPGNMLHLAASSSQFGEVEMQYSDSFGCFILDFEELKRGANDTSSDSRLLGGVSSPSQGTQSNSNSSWIVPFEIYGGEPGRQQVIYEGLINVGDDDLYSVAPGNDSTAGSGFDAMIALHPFDPQLFPSPGSPLAGACPVG